MMLAAIPDVPARLARYLVRVALALRYLLVSEGLCSLKCVKRASAKQPQVCLLSPHPLVLADFSRILEGAGYRPILRQLESMLAPELRRLPIPKASLYVVDAHAAASAMAALITNIFECSPEARVLVVGEKFSTSDSHNLLRHGAKGLLTYGEAREQLSRALPQISSGGFWVPRATLAGFVDSILESSRHHRLKVDSSAELSRREREVLDALLENLANKEIGSRLNISERTVKFHVSNLLNKFGVRRRADLILLCFQQRQTTAAMT
jgi:two-component system, NarL family, nitrate/nitrite response regulator NarL